MYLLRKIFFSAAHYYRVPGWSEEQNKKIFGPCSSIHGHGHDYVLDVMVTGDFQQDSGIVVNINDVDKVVKSFINEEFDGKFLNLEHPYFQKHMPTTEGIVSYMWNRLQDRFQGCRLHKLTLHENDFLYAEKGRDNMVTLTRKYHFSSAHRLHSEQLSEEENRRLFGKCNNVHGHGHNYYLEVTVAGEPDPVTGMIVNLSELDQHVEQEVLQKFDHKHLNLDTEEFKHLNPTSENLVIVIWNLLKDKVPNLYKIGLWETQKNYFEYYGPNR
jgi:6-pyruvoyltetrahydropterin/6-carboxytetrahydropterin synthase